MSLINLRDRTINAKIVYYGTALSGKTTSLQHVHRVVDPEGRTELVSLNTEGDRTLFFDFLPIPLGCLGGYQVKLQAFTVPGQVKYAVTRRYVLRGADGVMFVADSGASAVEGNALALRGLRENLGANGLDPAAIPLFMQYNKRDVADALPVEQLRATLNERQCGDLPTIATTGEGVFQAFSALCSSVLEQLAVEYRIGDPAEIREQLDQRLARIGAAAPPPAVSAARGAGRLLVPASAVPSAPRSSVIRSSGSADGPSTTEDLLEQAVGANIESAGVLAELHETRHELAAQVRRLAALYEMGTAISDNLDGEVVMRRVLSAALETVGAARGQLILNDPGTGRSTVRLAAGGVGRRPIVEPALLLAAAPLRARATDSAGTAVAALVAPLMHRGESLGGVVVLPDRDMDEAASDAHLTFLGAVAVQAAAALVNVRLHARVESFNRELETQVAERTKELAAACDELKVLDQMKDGFLASMSHELMTPLTSIGGFAEILSTTAEDDGETSAAERREFAGIVQREAGRLSRIVQSVLDLSQLESGQVAFESEPLDLRELLLQAYRERRPDFKARDVKVRVRVEEGLPPVMGDAAWVGRVLSELLSNACKFGPERAPVLVTVSADEAPTDTIVVRVDDTGPGVPDDMRDGVFERFQQSGDILTDKPSGLGVGLPMARLIVERSGGRIWVEPAPGGGASFRFSLPTVPVAASAGA